MGRGEGKALFLGQLGKETGKRWGGVLEEGGSRKISYKFLLNFKEHKMTILENGEEDLGFFLGKLGRRWFLVCLFVFFFNWEEDGF